MSDHERFLGIMEEGKVYENDIFSHHFGQAVNGIVEELFKRVNYKYTIDDVSEVVGIVYGKCSAHIAEVIASKIHYAFGDLKPQI